MAGVPYSGLVVDVDTDRVLYEHNADELRHPASLTKMMTLYLVFEALAAGEISEDTVFHASRFATSRPPSKLGLRPGDDLTVEEGILALVTRSANDAAATIAEGMAGSEPAFAQMMTRKARELGMRDTVFRNASGLPDPDQVTTARDMYRLGRALYTDFPNYYAYFSTDKFYYGKQAFANHNHLMERYPGMDGIKTGFINRSGFNLVASARRGGKRLIGVVFGGPSAFRRDEHMREILDDGFAQVLEGAPPGVITAEFDKPESLPNLVGKGRLFESPDPEFDEDEPVRPRRTQRLAESLGLDDLPVRASKLHRHSPVRISEDVPEREAPVRHRGAPSARHMQLVAIPKPYHEAPVKHAAVAEALPPRHGKHEKAAAVPERHKANQASEHKAKAAPTKSQSHGEKKLEVAHNNKAVPKSGPSCPPAKGKPAKCART
jgi:hypothetical protein